MSALLLGAALLLVAATMGLSLAHALEFPGKARLDEAAYRMVQTIYYPGFTLGGLVAELGSLLTVPVLLLLTPAASDRFPWLLGALVALGAGHAIYWLVTHPTNAVWLKDTEVTRPGSAFFSAGAGRDGDWRSLRDRWEWSHVARTVAFLFAFLSLVAVALT